MLLSLYLIPTLLKGINYLIDTNYQISQRVGSETDPLVFWTTTATHHTNKYYRNTTISLYNEETYQKTDTYQVQQIATQLKATWRKVRRGWFITQVITQFTVTGQSSQINEKNIWWKILTRIKLVNIIGWEIQILNARSKKTAEKKVFSKASNGIALRILFILIPIKSLSVLTV